MDQPAWDASCEAGSPWSGALAAQHSAALPSSAQLCCVSRQHQGEFTPWWIICEVLLGFTQAATKDLFVQLGQLTSHCNLPVTQLRCRSSSASSKR